jgi:hypothetical protein
MTTWPRRALPLGIALLTVVAFLPALAGSFLNWDDNVNFLENTAYRGLGPEQIRWAFTSVLFGHYIPLTRLSFSRSHALGGMDPRGYHLASLLLHVANAVAFYFVARRLLTAGEAAGVQAGRRESGIVVAATVAALVFGIHPLRVESVAWITGRADLLCGGFVLLTAWAHLRAVEGGGAARPGWIAVSTATLVAAILSKGAALPVVFGLLVLDVYPLGRLARLGWRRLLVEKAPLLLVTALGAAVVLDALRRGAVVTGPQEHGVGARLGVAAYTLVIYPLRFLWPSSLSPLYEMPARVSLLEPRFTASLAATVLITGGLLALRRRWPAGFATWVFSALMLVPTGLALRQGADLAPDRYSYLSGFGLALLAGAGVLKLIRLARAGRLSRLVTLTGTAAGLVVLVTLAASSWALSDIWRDSESLWGWAVERDPSCSICQGKLAESVLGGPGGGPARAAEAEQLLRRAIALRPDLPEAYFNLGTALVWQGRYQDAEAPLAAYMARAPGAASGPERLGLVYLVQRRYDAAIPLLREALARKPTAPDLPKQLAQALCGHARRLSAREQAAEADALVDEARRLGADSAACRAGAGEPER